MLANARHRAKTKGLPFNLTHEHLHEILTPTCPVLGLELRTHRGSKGARDDSPSLDRLVPELGYVEGNVMVISGKANRIKSDASFEELLAVAQFYKEHQ